MRSKGMAAAMLGGWALKRWRARNAANFQDKVVLITGGSRGLGLLLARRFGRAGARLVLCARDGAELMRARDELLAAGCDVVIRVCDVSIREDVHAMVDEIGSHYGRIDVVINNAGIIQVGPVEAMGDADFHAAMDANFWGAVNVSLAAIPHLRRADDGRIVNISSIGGAVAVPHLLPYAASKFALTGFSEGLRVELESTGVRVTTILPGLMRTGSFVHALVKGRREREVQWFAVAASLPFLTVSGTRAAERIFEACARGEGYVVIGLPAKALRVIATLAPNLTSLVFAGVNRILPSAGVDEPSSRATPGSEHRRGVANSFVTRLGDYAASENNEQYPSAPERVH